MFLAKFKRASGDVDVNDHHLLRHRQTRLISISKSPFLVLPSAQENIVQSDPLAAPEARQTKVDQHLLPSTPHLLHREFGSHHQNHGLLPDPKADESTGDRPPFWLELFYDLAFTATFASLTLNSEITTTKSVASYVVFFSLAWWIWTSQVVYDVRYYTSDWTHRLFTFWQLCIFGALAAFTQDFDIFWRLSSSIELKMTISNVANTITNIEAVVAAQSYPYTSFCGVSILLAVSRALLASQYFRVAHFAQSLPHKPFQTISSRLRGIYLLPITLVFSSLCFIASFVVLRFAPSPSFDRKGAWLKFLFWGIAITAEITAHFFAEHLEGRWLRGIGSLSERYATLTSIIMGEAMNSLAGTLRFNVTGLGFGGQIIALIIATAGVIYIILFLYFDGFRNRLPARKLSRQMYCMLHLPYHLSIIVTLEGLKNVLLYANWTISVERFIDRLPQPDNSTYSVPTTPDDGLADLLRHIGLDYSIQVSDSRAAFNQSVPAGQVQWLRWYTTVVTKLYLQYQEAPSAEAVVLYNEYMSDNHTVIEDLSQLNEGYLIGENMYKIFELLDSPLSAATLWIYPVAGVSLLALACTNYIQNQPRDRYAWGSIFTRVGAGCILILLSLLNINPHPGHYDEAPVWKLAEQLWTIPLLAFSLLVIAGLDVVFLWLAVRNAHCQLAEKEILVSVEAVPKQPFLKHPSESSQTATSLKGFRFQKTDPKKNGEDIEMEQLEPVEDRWSQDSSINLDRIFRDEYSGDR